RLVEPVRADRSAWHRAYSCYHLSELLYDGLFNGVYFDAHVSAFDGVWLRLAMSNPTTLIRHQACLTSLIWRVTQPVDGRFYTYPPTTPEYIQYFREVGEKFARWRGLDPAITKSYMPASLLPEVRAALIPWLQTIERPEWIWLTWRPALYLYLSLFCVTAIAIRHRSWRT
ncbi:MAG: hypothetical protein RMJ54_19570, partial [Roseiflexaceae bacterium]|nr:hypothetical protein [Roseiflexaceae bacterium]